MTPEDGPEQRDTAAATTSADEPMPSYTYPAEPDVKITECVDCSPWWQCALEADDSAAYGLAVREWHSASCPVWTDRPAA
jgi:hypothetical protein